MSAQRVVMQVLPRLVTGGVERGTIEMAQAIINNGWKAIVASAGGPMVAELEAIGATHVTLPLASKNPITMWRNVDLLADAINEYDVNIVHARSRAPAWTAFYAAQQTNRHFVTTFHNAYGTGNPFKKFYNSVMAKGEMVIAISDFVAAYAETIYRVPKTKLRTIPRGVDTERFDKARVDKARIDKLRKEWQIPAGQPVIFLPGRLTRWKGQLEFIDAVAALKRSDITCLIVGSGSGKYKQELLNKIQQRKVGSVIRLVNECRDMPAAFCIADIVVSASTRPEGFGRVIVEAQAMGCAVIATEHGGAAETVIHRKTGWLVPPGNSAKLSDAIAKTLALQPEQRKAVGTQAMAHVRENFTTALMTSRTLEVYKEILALDVAEEEIKIPEDVKI